MTEDRGRMTENRERMKDDREQILASGLLISEFHPLTSDLCLPTSDF